MAGLMTIDSRMDCATTSRGVSLTRRPATSERAAIYTCWILESMGKEQAVFGFTSPMFLFYSGVVVAKGAIIPCVTGIAIVYRWRWWYQCVRTCSILNNLTIRPHFILDPCTWFKDKHRALMVRSHPRDLEYVSLYREEWTNPLCYLKTWSIWKGGLESRILGLIPPLSFEISWDGMKRDTKSI